MIAGRSAPHPLLAEALAAWQDATRAALHRPGCSCCGGGGPVRLDPKWLAEDIDEALRIRLAGPEKAPLATAWEATREPGEDDMVRRLTRLSDAADSAAAGCVFADVIAMLRSVSGAR